MPLSNDESEVKADVQAMLWSMRLSSITRFFNHRFWEPETADAQHALLIEPPPRLESVAEHSWHVADSVLLLADRFPSLKTDRCVTLAILHDKLEIITGDSPASKQGRNVDAPAQKRANERRAIDQYLEMLRPSVRPGQREAILEVLDASSDEARFVKAIDKLLPLVFIVRKKGGSLTDEHLAFSLRYARQALTYFPSLRPHYDELCRMLVDEVARHRGVRPEDISSAVTESSDKDPRETTQSLPNIALYGPSGAGKSIVCDYLASRFDYFHCHPGGICRKLCAFLFDTESKTKLNMLNDALRGIDPEVWIRTALKGTPPDRPLVFDGIRFKQDWFFFRAKEYQIWKVDAPLKVRTQRLTARGQEFTPEDEQHAGETELANFDFDVVLDNSSAKSDLHMQIDRALRQQHG